MNDATNRVCECCNRDQTNARRFRCPDCACLHCVRCNRFGGRCAPCDKKNDEKTRDKWESRGHCRNCGDKNERPRSLWCSPACRDEEKDLESS